MKITIGATTIDLERLGLEERSQAEENVLRLAAEILRDAGTRQIDEDDDEDERRFVTTSRRLSIELDGAIESWWTVPTFSGG